MGLADSPAHAIQLQIFLEVIPNTRSKKAMDAEAQVAAYRPNATVSGTLTANWPPEVAFTGSDPAADILK